MSNLAREFADVVGFLPRRLAHIHKYRKLVADKKRELDPRKIISLDEFGLKVVTPITQTDSSYTALFNSHGNDAHNILMRWLEEKEIEPFWLEHDQVAPDILQYGHDNFYDYRFEQRFAQEQDSWRYYGTYSDERAQEFRAANRDERFPLTLRPAAYLKDIVGALDAASNRDNVLNECDDNAILKGQGDLALQFWTAVDDIKDYSGFFPDKRPPDGNNDKKKKDRIKAGKDWLGGLIPGGPTPGWQPT